MWNSLEEPVAARGIVQNQSSWNKETSQLFSFPETYLTERPVLTLASKSGWYVACFFFHWKAPGTVSFDIGVKGRETEIITSFKKIKIKIAWVCGTVVPQQQTLSLIHKKLCHCSYICVGYIPLRASSCSSRKVCYISGKEGMLL